jgi:radical SAM superfamily enzyme YgiQ (UPF0313 family)
MRQIINKPVSTTQLLDTARQVYRRGWPTLKLYFMIGHPSETFEDVQAIADLCKAVLAVGRQEIGRRANLHAGVSNFVPKPHTPFQWVSCDTIESLRAKQSLLKRQLRGDGLKLTWTQPEETMLEAWLTRGDRRMADVIYPPTEGRALTPGKSIFTIFFAVLNEAGLIGFHPSPSTGLRGLSLGTY